MLCHEFLSETSLPFSFHQATSIKQASAAMRLYHITITDSPCQMSLASNSVSLMQQTVLRYIHCKERITGNEPQEHMTKKYTDGRNCSQASGHNQGSYAMITALFFSLSDNVDSDQIKALSASSTDESHNWKKMFT